MFARCGKLAIVTCIDVGQNQQATKMRLSEADYLPQACGALFPGPWLVFAPHPDDETYGMGGTIAAARAAGICVRVVVVTDGGLGGDPGVALVTQREQEVMAALRILGEASVVFWRAPDRSLVPTRCWIEAAVEEMRSCAGGTVFFPSLLEPHPDHRATARIAWEAARMAGFTLQPVSYEISLQGPSKRLFDISPWLEVKKRAMAAYQSQEAQRPYASRVLALNHSRSWSLPATVSHAESFFDYPCEPVPLQVMLQRLQQRQLEGLLSDSDDGSDCSGAVADSAAVRISALQTELQRLRASRSWRLTQPLRALARRLRQNHD